jgi:hypothetical protein
VKLGPAVLRCGEVEVTVDLDAVTGTQWRDMRRATGLHQAEIIDGAANWGDFDCQAALMWVALRESEPAISFELVLEAFSYASVGEPDPEAADV